ncbi:MAG: FlgD immunoglobulin-like domain containing protein [Calditrichia bacterium]
MGEQRQHLLVSACGCKLQRGARFPSGNFGGTECIEHARCQSAAGPASYELQQNYPNPFNPETTVKFSLAAQHKSDQNVKVLVFNALGQQVRELYNGTLQPGTYEMKWDGRNQSGELLGSGTYFAMLQTGFFRETRKMLLIK